MGTRTALTLGLVLTTVPPAAAEDRFEFPLNSLIVRSDSNAKLSLGSVGLDSHAGNSYLAGRENQRYYFNIPGERPFQKVPGLLLRIPLGSSNSHYSSPAETTSMR
jgi:hypothetical protein